MMLLGNDESYISDINGQQKIVINLPYGTRDISICKSGCTGNTCDIQGKWLENLWDLRIFAGEASRDLDEHLLIDEMNPDI